MVLFLFLFFIILQPSSDVGTVKSSELNLINRSIKFWISNENLTWSMIKEDKCHFHTMNKRQIDCLLEFSCRGSREYHFLLELTIWFHGTRHYNWSHYLGMAYRNPYSSQEKRRSNNLLRLCCLSGPVLHSLHSSSSCQLVSSWMCQVRFGASLGGGGGNWMG